MLFEAALADQRLSVKRRPCGVWLMEDGRIPLLRVGVRIRIAHAVTNLTRINYIHVLRIIILFSNRAVTAVTLYIEHLLKYIQILAYIYI